MPTTKTKTSPSGLTPEEQQELERRGFLVKNGFGIVNLIDIFIHFCGFSILYIFIASIFILPLAIQVDNLGLLIFILTPVLFTGFLFGRAVFYYIGMGCFFYCTEGEIIFGKQYRDTTYKSKVSSLYTSYNHVHTIGSFIEDSKIMRTYFNLFIALTVLFSVAFLIKFKLLVLIPIAIILGIPFTIFLISKFYQSFHPLYAFGNLGSKIQSLTPRITEESEKIEKEFSTDMNFRILSDSFDTLSKDFSQISSYVIKLETIEQKANKGNLFDSDKYIGSLREDIVKPLTTLRSFLEKKKTELEESREEIRNLGALDAEINSAGQKVRVRVGGAGNGGAENLELQSKRSEPLRAELTENIGKLDVMIEKFGKI